MLAARGGTAVRDHEIARIGEFTRIRLAIELAEHILLDLESFAKILAPVRVARAWKC